VAVQFGLVGILLLLQNRTTKLHHEDLFHTEDMENITT